MLQLIIQEIKQLKGNQKNKILILLWIVVLLELVVSHTKSYLEYKEQSAVDVADIEGDKKRDLDEMERELSLLGIPENVIRERRENITKILQKP